MVLPDYDVATSFPSLLAAAHRASRGHRGDAEVAAFLMDAERHCLALHRALRLPVGAPGSWAPGVSRTFRLYDPKPRLITVSPFIDRVVHHALMTAIEPLLERYAIFDTYACRRGKGQHAALRRAQQFAREAPWVLKLDVARYFASIPHDRLLSLVERRGVTGGFLSRLTQIVHAGGSGGRGLPIGSLASQHLANLYLGRLDHHIKDDRGVRRYLRYMDDMLLFGERDALVGLHGSLRSYLSDPLLLEENRRVSQLQPLRDGVPFLGWRVYPRLLRLRPGTWRRFRRAYRWVERQRAAGRLSADAAACRVGSLFSHLQQGSTYHLRRTLLGIRRSGMHLSRLQPGQAGRLLEQRPAQRACGQPQQEHAVQAQRQPGPAALQHNAMWSGGGALRSVVAYPTR